MTPTPEPDYRIDYADLDVEDLVRQIRRQARGRQGSLSMPEANPEKLRSSLQSYLVLDDERPYELQQTLGLGGDWNLSPNDLLASHSNPLGRLISGVRRLARPLVKFASNTDLPIFKQFKINLGLAAAVHDLLQETAALRARIHALSTRLEALEPRSPDDHADGRTTDAPEPRGQSRDRATERLR